MAKKLSIVIGTRNRPDSFRRLVDSIEENTSGIDWELVVSDAGDVSIEDQPVATDEAWERIVVIPERPRLGCTKGYNRAFKASRGEFVIWLNDDVTVERGWAENSIRYMERNPQIGLGALYYDEPTFSPQVNLAWGLPYANFGIIRRKLGNSLGWFDEDLEMYGNDNSLTFRVLLIGYGVAAVPEAIVHHHPVDDIERIQNEKNKRRASDVLYKKYYEKLPIMRAVYERAMNRALVLQ